MKLHIFSDLHMDGGAWTPPLLGADVSVVAGDLYDDGRLSARWCANLAQSSGAPVLFVPGNHDFYSGRISVRLKEMRDICQSSGVTLLQNRNVVLGGVRFVGGTAWTDFELDGLGYQQLSRNAAKQFMYDFSGIFVGNGRGEGQVLTPEYTERMHRRTRRALDKGLEEAYEEPVVVVTHHAPSQQSLAARYERSALNPAYASNLDEFVGWSNARIFVHGHVHHSLDYKLGATRVICNPRGHSRSPNPGFRPDLLIDVE